MKEVILLTGQTLYDLAIQEYGHTDGIFLILEDNPGVVNDFADVPQPGTKVLVRLNVPELSDNNRAIAAEFARQGKLVASGLAPTVLPEMYVEDGYWVHDYVNEN
ncbi:MAG: hypothetical protein BGO32_08605 [Bacteroidetes bacterium 37-13]|nr:MAG: hypothetical protein BGO32_08605 [Bacteroidetes bacterium 37-13]